MKRLGLGILAVVLAAVFCLPAGPAIAQSTTKDVSQKTADAWEKVKSFTVDKKNDAVKFGKRLVRDSDNQLKKLEADAKKASGDTKTAYNEQIKEIKAKRAAAGKKLDEMGKATGSAWDSAKDGFADAYKDLRDSFEKAASKLKS